MVGASSDVTQTREPNATNQYTQIDPDGPGGQAAVTPQSDAAGNMTEDPTARSFEPAALGQMYEYDEENRLVAVRRVSDDALLMEIHYDAVGRRVETIQHDDPAVNPPLLTAPRPRRTHQTARQVRATSPPLTHPPGRTVIPRSTFNAA